MSALPTHEMTADEFVAWSMAQAKDRDSGRYELVDGRIIEMQSERLVHITVKSRLLRAFESAIERGKLGCRAVGDGATVRVSRSKVYKPDGLVYFGPALPPETVEVPNAVVIVEVVSPDSVGRDHGEKVEAYFAVPSVQHYLIVDPERRAVVHHARAGGGKLLTSISRTGALRLEPPGIEIEVERTFEG